MTIHRIEVRPSQDAGDPRGAAACQSARTASLDAQPETVHCSAVYLIEGDLDDVEIGRVANELLSHPVTEQVVVGAADRRADALVEVHPQPGVMDPEAEAVELGVRSLLGRNVTVRTGRRFDVAGLDQSQARTFAERCLANTLIHEVHETPYHPSEFTSGHGRDVEVRTVPLRELDDAALTKLSREAHLFLSLDEMQAMQEAYRRMDRDPREIELETLAQTWSEHCVHKTLKARVEYHGPLPGDRDRVGHEFVGDDVVRIDNLLGSTIAAATKQLMNDGIDWCLSVFVDNAGIIAFDDDHAVCFKVETHNHPSALEPYGGAATGIGGCIRDIIGTGLAARPIAASDIFCVGHLDTWAPDTDRPVPTGCLHPRRILSQVVAGVRDYGNRMGIPTVNGTVWFDDDYVGNPLVYCGCVGVMPRDRIAGDPRPGDLIVAMGGRTGRDGIHGATFSSAELTDTHVDEFSHAVQIGNPVTEKKVLDAIMEARDAEGGCLYNSITDCGAGGFSSAVGEMGEELGAVVQLEAAPLKYDGLTPTEVWISEAQERMVMAVSSDRLDRLQSICDAHDVELCVLGTFGTPDRELILNWHDTEVGRLPMALLHDGLPDRVRIARWEPKSVTAPERTGDRPPISLALERLLAHPNIASKQCIIEQYDHEVQGRSVIRPQVGPFGNGPSDAAVLLPVPGSTRGLAMGNGLATGLRDDPWLMAVAALDECVRNLVCVGADPERIAVLDNFCWPGCDDEQRMGELVRAAEGCRDAALAYRTPFISGKDSLNNQFTTDDGRTIRIPSTLLISGFGIVPDIARCTTMDAKRDGSLLLLVGDTTAPMGGSHFAELFPFEGIDLGLPSVDLESGPRTARAVASAIASGSVLSAHDCSEGGMLVAAAEMAFSGGLGLSIELDAVHEDPLIAAFSETPGRYMLEVSPEHRDDVERLLDGVPCRLVGRFNGSGTLTTADCNASIDDLRAAWSGTIGW